VRHGRARAVPSKAQLRLRAGDLIRIESPGGGGWGEA
jgi:N-methylhydantoinase B/oxoprolinase/acetone carboxylase alpha subunit